MDEVGVWPSMWMGSTGRRQGRTQGCGRKVPGPPGPA